MAALNPDVDGDDDAAVVSHRALGLRGVVIAGQTRYLPVAPFEAPL